MSIEYHTYNKSTKQKEMDFLLDEALHNYEKRVEDIAYTYCLDILFPYFEKYSLKFITGNGDYGIWYTNKTPKWFIRKYKGYYSGSLEIDKLPKRIRDILQQEVNHSGNTELGLWMPDYPEKE